MTRTLSSTERAETRVAQLRLDHQPAWYTQAACPRSGIDPRAWDPDWYHPTRPVPAGELADRREQARLAQLTCQLCPVRLECMAAGSAGLEWGVWGGIERTTVPRAGAGRTTDHIKRR